MGQNLIKPIKKEIAMAMIDKYRLRRSEITDTHGKPKDDTNSVWVSKEYMLDFFENRNPSATGLRIYLGAIGNFSHLRYDETNNSHVKKCLNQTNLIFVATEVPNGDKPTMANSINMIVNKKMLNQEEINLNDDTISFFGDERMADDEHEICPPPSGGCQEIS